MEKPAQETYSAFVLHDNQTWEQPTFSVPAGTPEGTITRALLARFGGFHVAGLQHDDDANENCVEPLEIE
jgi:hypothetical protein